MLELLARGHRLPARCDHAGDVRVNITITEPDGTTTKLNSPGAAGDPAAPRADWRRPRWSPCRQRRLDRAGRLAAARAPRPSGTPSWSPSCARRAPGWPSTPARPRCRRWSTRCPTARTRPDEAQRRGARLLHRWRRRRARVRPAARPRRPPASSSTAASAPCSSPSARTAPCSSTPDGAWHATPPAHHRRQHRRCRRLQPLRLPPRRRPRAPARRTPRTGRRLRQRRRRPPRHDHPPPRRRSAPELVGVDRPRPHSTGGIDHDRPDHHRPRCGSTPTRAADKHDVIRALAARRRRRRPSHRRRTSSSRTRSPARPPPPPGCPAASRSRTAAPPAVEVPTLAFARLVPPVDFGAKDGPADLAFLIAAPAGGDADAPQAADQAGPGPGQEGLHRRPRAARTPTRRSSTWSPACVGEPRRPPRPPSAAARSGAAAAAAAAAGRRRGPQPAPRSRSPGGGHGVPDRHRPHLHGRRGPRGRRRSGRRRRSPVETQGSAGANAAAPRRPSPRRRRGDLRRRRGRPRPGPVRRQAGGLARA